MTSPTKGYAHRPGTGKLTTIQRQALKRKTDCELMTGMTPDQLKAFHAAQRARVLERIEKAA